jgi:dihydrofolate synthase/folylpolyglutamate synthase
VANHAQKIWTDGLPLVLLFASLKTKDAAGVLRPFHRVADQVLTVPIEDHDCRPPAELALLAESMGFPAKAKSGLADAMAALRKPARVLVFGSLYLAGELLALNGPLPD